MNTLAEFVAREIERRNGSIRGFEVVTGVSRETLRRILAGERPSIDNLEGLAVRLDVPICYLLQLAGVQLGPGHDSLDLQVHGDAQLARLVRLARELSLAELEQLLKFGAWLQSQGQGQP